MSRCSCDRFLGAPALRDCAAANFLAFQTRDAFIAEKVVIDHHAAAGALQADEVAVRRFAFFLDAGREQLVADRWI